jgi:hypothetical protein
VGRQKCKGQSTNLGVLRLKITCETNGRRRLWESFWKKRPKLWNDKYNLHHDIAPAHDVLRVPEFLAKKFIIKIDHPTYLPHLSYSPILASNDF